MIKVINFNSTVLTSVEVIHGNMSLEFVIGTIISKRNKEELDGNKQFKLLNAYLDYKGGEFKSELFERLKEAEENVVMLIGKQDIHPLPYHIAHPIFDLFDILDVFNFVKNIYKIKPPSNLMDEFDMLYETDGRGTRVQTYLKDDYLELAALSIIIKIGMLPVYHFAYTKNQEITCLQKEYILFHFIKSHKIYETPPMVKLLNLVDKLLNLPTNKPEETSIRILESRLPKDEMIIVNLAKIVIQRLSIATIVDDDEEKNIVTKIYNYINNKLKPSGDISTSYREKSPLKDVESSEAGDKESIIESHRTMDDIPKGFQVELDWAISVADDVIDQMPNGYKKYIDRQLMLDALNFCDVFKNGNIQDEQVAILGIIFKRVTDPRSLKQVSIESIINLLAIGFSYLWNLGFKQLALLLTAQENVISLDSMTINSRVNQSRLSKEIKEKLTELFPYERPTNETTTVNLADEWINNVANKLFEKKWMATAYDTYVMDGLGEKNNNLLLPANLKVLLAEFLIKHEYAEFETTTQE